LLYRTCLIPSVRIRPKCFDIERDAHRCTGGPHELAVSCSTNSGSAGTLIGCPITFRLDPALKAALSDLAEREGKSLGEFLRELARDRIRQARRLSFEREARRQSIAAAAAAGRPGTDEHAVMQELDEDLESFGGEWT